MSIKLKVKKNEVAIVVISSSSYKKKEIELVKQLYKKHKTICYVNLRNSLDTLLNEFHKNHIDEKNFLFIDAVTPESKVENPNCIYLHDLNALTKLSLTIKKSLKTGRFPVLIFDSLSVLSTHHKIDALTRFIHDLFSVIKKTAVMGVFPLQAGTNKKLIGDISMFADYVVEVK